VRPPDTWGLVIERKRRAGELDRLAWFCDRCQGPLHEVAFSCENIETQLGQAIARFNADARLRTCGRCGAVLAVPGASA
jgi:3-hydroxyanthranilate 3,4-dioxygenase